MCYARERPRTPRCAGYRASGAVGGRRRGIVADRCDLAEQGFGAGAAEHAQAREAVWIACWARPARDNRGRAGVARRPDGRYDRRVVMARGVAEPVRGDAVTVLYNRPRGRDLVGELFRVEGDQVGVTEPLRIELPSRPRPVPGPGLLTARPGREAGPSAAGSHRRPSPGGAARAARLSTATDSRCRS